MTGGRPFRFLATVLGVWIGGRVVLLWPQIDSVATMVEAIVPPVAALAIAPQSRISTPTPSTSAKVQLKKLSTAFPQNPPTGPMVVRPARAAGAAPLAAELPSPQPLPLLLPERPLPHGTAAASRWRASGWLILRGGAPRVNAAQLGGSQVGGRIGYALDAGRHVALSVRAMASLHGRGTEIAAGLDWQPTAAPVHLLAERRIAVEGGRSGASMTLVGGLDPMRVGGAWRLEAYGQAGVIVRDGASVQGFGDGAARLSRPVMDGGVTRVDLGLGLWGGVQRGAGRLDFGPSLAVIVPAGGQRLRVTLDWRQRVAGNAAPGSGPALSVGTDF